MSDLPVDRGALLGEAYRRGILPPDQRGLYEEGMRRGLFQAPQAPAGAPQPTQGDVMAPESPGTPAAPAVPDIANPLGAMGSAITRAPGELRRQQESFTARSKAAQDADRLKQGYEPGVDYEGGTGFLDRIQMQRMDNPAERQAMLESKYGEQNVFRDKGGRFYVQTPEGKRASPEGEGFITNLLAGIYGQAPQIAGGTAGAILGAGGGPAGAIGGAALGTAAGKAADEFVKGLFGQGRKTAGEMAGAIGQAGVEGAIGEGAGRIVTQIPGAVGRAFRKNITGSTPETIDLARSVADAGGVAPLRSVTPGLTSGIQKQDISAKLGADWLEERNRGAVQNRLRDIIEQAGKTPDQIRTELGEILNPAARVSAQEAGAPIVGSVRQHAAQLEGEVANLARDADRVLTGQLGILNSMSRRSPAGALGEDVAQGIAQARTDFSNAMQKGYAQIDQMTGGAPVVPQRLVQRRAQDVLAALPKDAQGNPIFGDARVLQSIRQLADTPTNMPLGEAKAIRSTLGDFGELKDMTPGVAKQQFEQLRRAQDAAIGQAAQDPVVAPAIRLLRQLDNTYAEGIRKFGDAEINRMVSQARTGIAPDPGKVAEAVLVPGQQQRAATLKRMVGPDVWRRVAAADWENNIIGPATDNVTGEISARRLAAAVAERDKGGMLDLAYGPRLASEIRLYSQRMGARGGKVPAESLAPDNFGQTMRQLEVAQREQDAFLKTDYLSALAKPGPLDDGAVNFVLKPGEETRLVEAQRFFGDTSPQMVGIRDQARKELLNSAIIPTTTGAGTTVAGEGIEKALASFTPKQQEILFPGGLAEDMRRLSKEIRFMFPARPDQMSGGLIAGAVKDAPLFGSLKGAAAGAIGGGGVGGAIGMLGGPGGAMAGAFPGAAIGAVGGGLAGGRLAQVAYYEGLAWIFSQPGVVRVLSEGLKPGPGQAATRETVRMIFRAAAAGELDNDQPPSPQPIVEQTIGARYAQPSASVRAPPPPRASDPDRRLQHSVGGL